MTINYTAQVATCRKFSCFLKLLARWRGSIYKLVWLDLIMFLTLYYTISLTYRFIFNSEARQYFEKFAVYCDKYTSMIPLSFVLGFYVNAVMNRWCSQYMSIPLPDNIALIVGAQVKGQDNRARIVRRTIVRYVCATFTITLTLLSSKMKKRFPTLDHLIEAGLLTIDEKKIMNELDQEFPSYSKYWVPLTWAINLVNGARHEGLIQSDGSVKMILKELLLFRKGCGGMLDYDCLNIPLVYTQVVTLVVYSYFVVMAIGKQYISSDDENTIDLYFPFLPVLEFFFYMGWLRVAQTLISPYGDDDDDFEVVGMIDRNVQVCYLLVDKINQQHPKLVGDWFEALNMPSAVAKELGIIM